MVAGLGAEVWAETREEGEGMIESEVRSRWVQPRQFVYTDRHSTTTTTSTTHTARADARTRRRRRGCARSRRYGAVIVARGERDVGGGLGYDACQGMCRCHVSGELRLSDLTGTQAGDVSRAVCEQASWDDGCDGNDCDELGEWE